MSTLPANINTLIQGLEKTSNRIKAGSSDTPFLKLSKGGVWAYGPEDMEVEIGSTWAVHPNSFRTGYCAWGNGELKGEEMRSIVEDPVTLSDLPDVGASWKQQVSCLMYCTNGEDKGTQVLYKASSKGGLKATSGLLDELLHHISESPGDAAIVPLVELDVDSYKHKEYGKIYTPTLTLTGWTTFENAEPEQLDEPKPEPEQEQEEQAQQPTRRRRRKAS